MDHGCIDQFTTPLFARRLPQNLAIAQETSLLSPRTKRDRQKGEKRSNARKLIPVFEPMNSTAAATEQPTGENTASDEWGHGSSRNSMA